MKSLTTIRDSVLLKVVGALMIALVVSTVITGVMADRMTRSALEDQAARLVRSHLGLLEDAYEERERELVVSLRNLAQILTSLVFTDREHRPDLIAELGRAAGNLELDVLRLVDTEGRELDPPAGVGDGLLSLSEISGRPPGESSTSRVLRTTRGEYVQAVAIPLTTGDRRFLLVGGFEFSDPFAYQLRERIGNEDEVILVAADRVAGSTLLSAPGIPPRAGDGRLPSTPTAIRVGRAERLVAYAQVGRPDEPDLPSVGVIMSDRVGPLNRSLSERRFIASAVLMVLVLAMGWLLFRALIRPLQRLAGTASEISDGDIDASFPVRGTDEISRLAASLERMRLELRNKLDLVARQADDLQQSSHRIVAAQDDERQRLARDLHDGIQQQLVVLRMRIGMLEEADRDPAVPSSHAEVGRELDQVIERMREVTQDLYPSILVDRGLIAALHSYVGRLPVTARFTWSPDPFPRLPVELESGAYFLLGEAMTNALKHSGASEIAVSVRVERGLLVAEVVDDGRGFVPGSVRRRSGLLHMEDRARSLGGLVEIRSEGGGGTRVTATFPLEAGGSPVGPTGRERWGRPDDVAVNPRRAGGRTAPPRPGG